MPSKAAQDAFAKMTVICIDDDPAVRALSVRALAKSGFRVNSGGSATAAIEMARRTPDLALILLDVHMPGTSGFETLQIIKSDPLLQHVPVLMISATADPEKAREQAHQLGAVDLLTYPITDEQLVSAARSAIGPQSQIPRRRQG